MRTRVCLVCALLAAALLPAGCQPLKYEKTLKVDTSEVQVIEFDPPRYEQKVSVHVTASGNPVSAYLVRSDDKGDAQEAIMSGKAPKSVLASKEKAEDITLDATVPAKSGYALILKASGGAADVTVKLTGR
jgi:hypothetical protein